MPVFYRALTIRDRQEGIIPDSMIYRLPSRAN